MVRQRYKSHHWGASSLLARILFGMMMVGVFGGLTACRKGVENDLGGHSATHNSSESVCEDWVNVVEACPVMRDKSGREHMIAVLREQMNGLSEQDKQKKCQELNSFWQVACGVTPTR